MSYPYLSDLFHALLHIDVYAPIPMFGIFVAFAVLAATSVFRRAVLRAEDIGRLPSNAHLAVGDLAWVTLIAGILGARIFHVMDHLDVYQQDPAKAPLTMYSTRPFGSPPAMIVAVKQRITKNTPSPNEVKTANLRHPASWSNV